MTPGWKLIIALFAVLAIGEIIAALVDGHTYE